MTTFLGVTRQIMGNVRRILWHFNENSSKNPSIIQLASLRRTISRTPGNVMYVRYDLMQSPEQTYNVHECEDIVLHMLLAVKAHHGVVHSQQHLDVVVVCLGVPPLPLGIGQFLLHQIQSRGEVCNPEISNCRKTVSKEGRKMGLWDFDRSAFSSYWSFWGKKFHMWIEKYNVIFVTKDLKKTKATHWIAFISSEIFRMLFSDIFVDNIITFNCFNSMTDLIVSILVSVLH